MDDHPLDLVGDAFMDSTHEKPYSKNWGTPRLRNTAAHIYHNYQLFRPYVKSILSMLIDFVLARMYITQAGCV